MTKNKDLSTPEHFRKLANLKAHLEIRERLLAIAFKKEGMSHKQIAEKLDRSVAWSKKWNHRFNKNPVIESLSDDPRPGRPTKITPEIEKFICEMAENGPEEGSLLSRFRRLDFVRAIKKRFGVAISDTAIGVFLKKKLRL
jgi:transposase